MSRTDVPRTTIQRLPLYLRCLLQAEEERLPLVNSGMLAEMAGTNAPQVRKDLSYLGELGTRGIGYDVRALIDHISSVLGLHDGRRAVLVGFGRLGGALLGYPGFGEHGFRIVAVLDTDPAKIGAPADGILVSDAVDLEAVVASTAAEIAIMTTPAGVTQAVVDRLVAVGVRGILNLAPVHLVVPEGVAVRQVSLSADLQVLSYYLAQNAL
jgi:redox-sensing transcriptional repressor